MSVKQHPVLRNKATPRAWRVTGRGIRALPLHSRRLFEFAPAVAAAVDVQWARFVRQVAAVLTAFVALATVLEYWAPLPRPEPVSAGSLKWR